MRSKEQNYLRRCGSERCCCVTETSDWVLRNKMSRPRSKEILYKLPCKRKVFEVSTQGVQSLRLPVLWGWNRKMELLINKIGFICRRETRLIGKGILRLLGFSPFYFSANRMVLSTVTGHTSCVCIASAARLLIFLCPLKQIGAASQHAREHVRRMSAATLHFSSGGSSIFSRRRTRFSATTDGEIICCQLY